MRTLLFPFVLVLALATGASAQSSGKLSVSVTGVRNDSGSVRCGLYSSADGFREPGREMRGAVAPIKNGQATCVFSAVPAGTYAVAVTPSTTRRKIKLFRKFSGLRWRTSLRGSIGQQRLFRPVATQ